MDKSRYAALPCAILQAKLPLTAYALPWLDLWNRLWTAICWGGRRSSISRISNSLLDPYTKSALFRLMSPSITFPAPPVTATTTTVTSLSGSSCHSSGCTSHIHSDSGRHDLNTSSAKFNCYSYCTPINFIVRWSDGPMIHFIIRVPQWWSKYIFSPFSPSMIREAVSDSLETKGTWQGIIYKQILEDENSFDWTDLTASQSTL